MTAPENGPAMRLLKSNKYLYVHMYVCMVACLEYLLELICFDRVAKFGHRAGFDLPNALAGYIELLA